MKYKFMFLFSLMFFSQFSFGQTLATFQPGILVNKVITPEYGYIYKVVNTITCVSKTESSNSKVYYKGALLGVCTTSTLPSSGFQIADVTGDIVLSFSCNGIPCGGEDHPLSIRFYQKRPVVGDYYGMGGEDNIILSRSYTNDASLADSVSFPALKSNTSQRKPLVNAMSQDSWFSLSPGKLTIKPSAASGNMGIIQDENNHNHISYTVEGATWDPGNSEWVIQSNEQNVAHNLIINPSQSAIAGGKYSGYVTVTLYSN